MSDANRLWLMASQTKHIYFNITMFSLMESKEKIKIGGGVSNFLWTVVQVALGRLILGHVYEFVCISFTADNLNCFRAS